MAVVMQILVMLIIAATGLVLRRTKILRTEGMKSINLLVLRVAMPAMMLMMTQKRFPAEIKAEFMQVFWFSLVFMGGLCLLIQGPAKKLLPDSKSSVFTALCCLPNAGFMGLPLVQAMYGERGALLLAAYIASFIIVLFTLVEHSYTGRWQRPSQAVKNPGLVFSLLALVLFLLDIRFPEPFPTTFDKLGGLTTPLTMLLAGARMSDFRFNAIKDSSLWIAILLRLLLLPMICLLFMILLNIGGFARGVILLASAMPSAVAGLMFAEHYKKDAVYAATALSLSTILCLASIPLLLNLLKSL